ncbi:MAG: hypothetical protein IAE77_00515 [Prosthecobacter sp.]|uniref:hypothetical protein n=1 Tax=Prosthecobacter sp. TaxID=1965333 RepID=UPI0019ECA2B0|nr:hypothetical protein [Prosthecobacter sp.]MBE2281922.1 hypothetical protein [Prosthecobacter sp.]
MARTRKTTSELLLPGASVWQSWTGADGELCQQTGEFTAEGSRFGKEATRRVLALPSTHFWVLPAWLKGETEHLRSMALLHLERMGVKTNEDEASVQVRSITGKEGANLARILALKDQPVPLSDTTYLPDEVTHHALCYPMVQNSITLFRELGRLVVAITAGSQLIYCAPLSSPRLDDHALAELNNICLQLGFQGVLGRLESIVLWIDEGDLGKIQRVTGLAPFRCDMPAPTMPPRGSSLLMPEELVLERQRQGTRSRTRFLAMSFGAAAAAAIALVATLTAFALKERNMLREKVAELMPRASRVMDHKRAWMEAAPAVDPTTWPQRMLLHCMEPESSKEALLTHWEWTPDMLSLMGRMPSASLALEYTQALKDSEALAHFGLDGPPPLIAGDQSATFEMKGGVAHEEE